MRTLRPKRPGPSLVRVRQLCHRFGGSCGEQLSRMQLLPARRAFQRPQLHSELPALSRCSTKTSTTARKLRACQIHEQAKAQPSVRAAAQATDILTEQLTGDKPETSAAPASGKGTYSWTGRWWPVHVVDSLNPKVPQHVDLLGKSMVIWGDSKGNWHCMEDKCPHRLAPLSEGRVEKDNIMCCYHGWTFSGNGSCTSIPQLASDPKAHDNACSSKRSCVTSYPTHVENGLLWVWPEAGPEAAAKAAMTKPQEVQLQGCMPWYVRDLPLRYDFLLENVFDPSHIPHAHHGVQGNRYQQMRGWVTNAAISAVHETGVVGSTKTAFGLSEVAFEAPFYVAVYTAAAQPVSHEQQQHELWLLWDFGPELSGIGSLYIWYKFNGKLMGAQMAVVPTKPGWSRIFLNFPRPGVIAEALRLPLPAKWLMQLKLNAIPLDHAITRNERLLPADKGVGGAVTRAYYLPSPVDGLVTGLRKWFQEFGGQVPTCSPADVAAMPPVMPKKEVLDRWKQHTKQCSHCLKALATVEKLQAVNVVVGVAAAVAFVAQAVAATALAHMPGWATAAATAASVSVPSFLSWAGPVGTAMASWWQVCQTAGLQHSIPACAVLAVLSVGLYRVLADLHQKFFYEDYVHAFKD